MAVNEVEIPRNARWELAQLKSINLVPNKSIKYELDEQKRSLIYFDVTTDILLDPRETVILDIEPIVLRYADEHFIGQFAPEVLSGRADFPRDLPHLFPVSENQPASLCLARSGLQSIYNVSGIKGVVARLLSWLNDAKTETLYEDGWEPVPLANTEKMVLGTINIAALQSHAYRRPEGGYGLISVPILYWNDGSVFVVQPIRKVVDKSEDEILENAGTQIQNTCMFDTMFRNAAPLVFVWPPINQIEPKPRFNTWIDMESLKAGLKKTELDEPIDEAFNYADIYFNPNRQDGSHPDLVNFKHRAIVLIIGLWRPKPIDRTIAGLSEEDGPRSLELRTYYLKRPIREIDRWSEQTTLYDFYDLLEPKSCLFEAVSGEAALTGTALLGAGALGITFADYAVRGGTKLLTVIDKDFLSAHNIARHRGNLSDIGRKKTDIVEHLATTILPDVAVKKFNDEIVALDDESLLEKFRNVNQVIDATADPLVRRRLSRLKGIELPVMRSEIFHKGQLGISLLTRLGVDQNLNCLFYQLLALAMHNGTIRDWLNYENSRTYEDEELMMGYSCGSKTTKLPAYKIDSHASTAFALAKSKLPNLSQSLIALNLIDSEGLALGTEIITPESIHIFHGKSTNGWRILVATDVLGKLHKLRTLAVPNETGGYLFGAMDESAKEIYVVAASPEPPETLASSSSLQLGRWGKTGFEKTFMRRTRNRLPPIGTWHSHPVSSAEASKKDWTTLANFTEMDARIGVPTVMAITGLKNDAFYVEG